jgi:membrane-bound lytic murein transglycosylase A
MLKFTLLFLFFTLQGCLFYQKVIIKGNGDIRLKQADFQSLKNWENDNHKKTLQAFIHSCNKFSKMEQNRLIGGQIGDITVGDFRDVCDIAQMVKTMSSRQAKNFFENWFKPFLVENRLGNSSGIFTGYYEASLKGSKIQSGSFRYPVYERPKNLDITADLTRQKIEEGALSNKGLELFYTDDKVELFFMHIQGSGRVEMQDGNELRIAYAGRNKQPFTSIGSYMADKNYLQRDNLNSVTIKEWLKNNPDKADEVMNINAAYTFFKISDGEYVVGGQGVPLTAESSLAVDSSIIPYGFPLWVETNLKDKTGILEKYSHLFIAQDTGSAIKGTVRGDIFFGYGKKAEEKAGYMAAKGQYYILLPTNVADKITGK